MRANEWVSWGMSLCSERKSCCQESQKVIQGSAPLLASACASPASSSIGGLIAESFVWEVELNWAELAWTWTTDPGIQSKSPKWVAETQLFQVSLLLCRYVCGVRNLFWDWIKELFYEMLFYWIERERMNMSNWAYTCWFIPQMPSIARLGQVESRTQEVNPDFPFEWQALNTWDMSCCLPGCTFYSKKEFKVELEFKHSNSDVGCTYPKWQLNHFSKHMTRRWES